MRKVGYIIWCTFVALPLSASAAPVRVEAAGSVDFNGFLSPPLSAVHSGDPASLVFQVDSDTFLDSPSFPTRGYPIEPSSFGLRIGSVEVGLADPFPAGQTPFFVLRNNDPAVDGFVVSRNIDFPIGVPVNVSSVDMLFLRTFNTADVWPTLDILDALGTYDLSNLSSYEWTLNVGPSAGMEIAYESISLTLVPDASGLALVLLGAVLMKRR